LPKDELKSGGGEDNKLVLTSVVTIKTKDKASAESMVVFTEDKFKEDKKELTFEKKHSPKTGKFWRLVHDREKVLMLFEAEGETQTARELFCGTSEECEKEIETLGLKNK